MLTIAKGIGMHMDTAPVARDIVEIFERHGEWREVEAQRLMMSMGSFKDAAAQETAVRTAYRPGEEMVQYWGFSYGSILGATLAAMYPERIKRAVLDGVLDSHDYMTGGWTSNLRDTDLLLARLASYCFDGGPTNCAIYHPDGPAVIIDNIQMTLTHLQSHPISVLDVDGQGPQVVTYSTFSAHIREIVYNPLKFFPTTTQILHDLSQGNGTSLASWKLSLRPDLSIPVPEDCEKDGPYSPSCFTAEDHGHTGALMGILCSDAVPDRLNQSREEYMEYAQKIMAQSRLIGARWAALQIPCTAWKARPHWRYDGKRMLIIRYMIAGKPQG